MRVRLAADAHAPGHARDALQSLTGRLSRERLQTLELIASELVTNAVRHSPAEGPGALGLEILCGPRTVSVAVTDPGEGFDVDAQRPEPGADGGFGLYLVDELADRWSVEPVIDGTRVTAEFAIERPG